MSAIIQSVGASVFTMAHTPAQTRDAPSAYAQAVDDHYANLYRFALQLARNPTDAEDLTQQAYLKLARNQAKIKDMGKVKSWLYSTLYRQFIDQYRRQSRYTDAPAEEQETPELNPRQQMAKKADAERVHAALAQLDESVRAPLTLFYLEDFSYREIAAALSIPVGTVMSRLSRGKTRLAQLLTEEPLTT